MRYNHEQTHLKSAKSNISKNFLRLKLFLVRVIRKTLKHQMFLKVTDFSSGRQERPEESKNILKKLKTADIMCRVFVTLFLIMTTIACGTTSTGEEDLPAIPGKIAFSAKDDGGTFQIFTMNADGSSIRQLTNDELFSIDPAWSPDGTRIAFARSSGSTAGGSLWVMDADGGSQQPLVTNPRTGSPQFGSNPAWSPDGTKLAFNLCLNCERGGSNFEIFVADLQTGTIDTLTGHPASDNHPAWSPNGRQIAFVSDRDFFDADTLRFRQDLYVINSDGTGLQRLTETGNATRPVWGPDNNFIAYEWGRGGNHVYLYENSSGQITRIESGLQFTGNSMWNKNGTKLLVSGRKSEGSQPELRLLNIEVEPPEILQNLVLDDNSVGRDYDWYTD